MFANNLKAGYSKGCSECRPVGRNARHRLSHSRAWRTWVGMIQRCHNPKNPSFASYGDRGIYVCDSWRERIENFVDDMGLPPDGKTLERIDNDGPYAPENCRWASKAEQMRNTTRNVYVEYNGATMTIAELSRLTGINRRTLEQRHKKGHRGDRLVRPVAA